MVPLYVPAASFVLSRLKVAFVEAPAFVEMLITELFAEKTVDVKAAAFMVTLPLASEVKRESPPDVLSETPSPVVIVKSSALCA